VPTQWVPPASPEELLAPPLLLVAPLLDAPLLLADPPLLLLLEDPPLPLLVVPFPLLPELQATTSMGAAKKINLLMGSTPLSRARNE
jgi:hypothetical protein